MGASAVKKTGLKTHCKNIAKTVSKLAIRLATEKFFEKSLEACIVCRLIHLNKNRGVPPTGIAEVLRHIIGKCIIKRKKKPPLLGQQHKTLPRPQVRDWTHNSLSALAIWKTWEWSCSPYGRKNAFNCLKRKWEFENIQRICPSFLLFKIPIQPRQVYTWQAKHCSP